MKRAFAAWAAVTLALSVEAMAQTGGTPEAPARQGKFGRYLDSSQVAPPPVVEPAPAPVTPPPPPPRQRTAQPAAEPPPAASSPPAAAGRPGEGPGRGGSNATARNAEGREPPPQSGQNRRDDRDFQGGYGDRGRDDRDRRDFARRDRYRERPDFGDRRDYERDRRDRGRSFNYRGRDYAVRRAEPFRYPPGWGYRPWYPGERLPRLFISTNYFFDYEWLGLPPPPRGTRWVRYDSDALLVDTFNGRIVDVIYDVFY